MQITANTAEEYIAQLPDLRKEVISGLRSAILANLPAGFEEVIGYGMIGYVVPHSMYPKGYHSTPKLPLPFMNLASQKNHVAVYHMAIYANSQLFGWFVDEYNKFTPTKLDMGKGCIRFTNMNRIPYALIGELAGKITPQQWIALYESKFVNKERNTKA